MSFFWMLFAAVAAPSDTPTGTLVPGGQTSSPVSQIGSSSVPISDEQISATPEVRKLVRRFAQCVVAKHPAEAAWAVVGDLRNREIVSKYPSLRDTSCFWKADREGNGTKLIFPGDTFRYAIAEALVAGQIIQPLTDVTAAPALSQRAHDPARFLPPPGLELTEAQKAVLLQASMQDEVTALALHLGECIVRADPTDSYRLLFTEPASANEASAAGALQSNVRSCAPAGRTIAISVSTIRGGIAVNYYRLAHELGAIHEVEKRK